jgi:aryl-alcohol dehydrogenase-like predicted oxidoreductase
MSRVEKISIGGAKFGYDYDYLNNSKILDKNTVCDILKASLSFGIHTLDTASGYGVSEQVIGDCMYMNNFKKMKIVTKVGHELDKDFLIENSLKKLKIKSVYAILFHNFKNFKKNPSYYDKLIIKKKEKKIEKIGFSLYFPEELEYLLNLDIPLDLVQLPFSIFDQRFESYFSELKKRGVEIHTRSTFLHGLYFKKSHQLSAHFNKIKKQLDSLKELSDLYNIDIAAICLKFSLQKKDIDKVIIGVDNLDILSKNIGFASSADMSIKISDELSRYSIQDKNILFPHNWIV